jgi:DNA-directed RNA polymerase I subunit RPA1
MAHFVRILHSKTQKTIRMHYANCNTYNADFDGDEMNCHFPQNYLAAAESKYIAATDLQFIVPTDGSPLRGLIQDHVDAGIKMTCKDTFFDKWMFQQLLFNGLASLPGLEVIRKDQEIELMPPAILQAQTLVDWQAGHYDTSASFAKGNARDDVGGHIVPEMPGISVERKAKLSAAGFGEDQQEHMVLIRDGEPLRGILDKAAFGDAEFLWYMPYMKAMDRTRQGYC